MSLIDNDAVPSTPSAGKEVDASDEASKARVAKMLAAKAAKAEATKRVKQWFESQKQQGKPIPAQADLDLLFSNSRGGSSGNLLSELFGGKLVVGAKVDVMQALKATNGRAKEAMSGGTLSRWAKQGYVVAVEPKDFSTPPYFIIKEITAV